MPYQSASTYRPVIVEVTEFVGKSLHVIWFESWGIVDDVVMSGSYCTLAHRLRHKEEVIPENRSQAKVTRFSGFQVSKHKPQYDIKDIQTYGPGTIDVSTWLQEFVLRFSFQTNSSDFNKCTLVSEKFVKTVVDDGQQMITKAKNMNFNFWFTLLVINLPFWFSDCVVYDSTRGWVTHTGSSLGHKPRINPLLHHNYSYTWTTSKQETCGDYSKYTLNARAPRKHFSWTSPGPVAFENGQALIFFRQARKNPFDKISSYQDFTSKQTLVLVSPLSFKNSNP